MLSFRFPHIALLLSIIGLIFGIKAKKENNKNVIGVILNILVITIAIIFCAIGLPDNNKTNDYNNDIHDDGSYEETNGVKGKYSSDVFSGNPFEYNTGYNLAIFMFSKDSTFEVKYDTGDIYKGIYELYNESFISIKVDAIKNDTSINNNQLLAVDINNVANEMMKNNADISNVYLIWFETDNNVLQPFMVNYNPDSHSGIAVNILVQVHGTFKLK